MRSVLFSVMVVLGLAPLSAQAQESRGSVSAIGGIARTWDDEGSLGAGWALGGAVDRVVFGTTRVEGSFEVLTHDRDEGYFLSNGRIVVAGASLVHRFGRGRTQPYVAGGLTIGRHTGTNTFAGEQRPLNVTNAGYRGAFGIAFRAGERFELAPEIRWNGFFVRDDSAPVWIPSFGIRFGWRY